MLMIEDLSVYEFLEEFTLYEASYLMHGFDPIPDHLMNLDYRKEIIRDRAYSLAKQLIRDAEEGALDARRMNRGTDDLLIIPGPPVSCDWIATRQALKDWAIAKGKKPAFLFPEEIVPKGESALKNGNLLKTLYCIAVDAYGYDPDSKKSDIPKEIADAVAEYGNGETINEKTIRGWLKDGYQLIPRNPQKS